MFKFEKKIFLVINNCCYDNCEHYTPAYSEALKQTGIISTLSVVASGGGGVSHKAIMDNALKCESISPTPLRYLSLNHLKSPAMQMTRRRMATSDTVTRKYK